MPEPWSRFPSPLAERIGRLHGPILVLGASGFVGANLMRTILGVRTDVHGTTTRTPAWRLEGLPAQNVSTVDLLIDSNLDALLDAIRPRIVFNCVAYGAYSFETDSQLIYRTNFQFITRLLPRLEARSIVCYVHAGSSSEYGDKAAGPSEQSPTAPNSDYAVSKVATANLIYYYGKRKHFPCANLRLYSVFGPLEDASRLIPNVIRRGLEAGYPDFVNPAVSRDFVYVDDVTEAFLDTALQSERSTIMASRSTSAQAERPRSARSPRRPASCSRSRRSQPSRCPNECGTWQTGTPMSTSARQHLGWEAQTTFEAGLQKTIAWYKALPDKRRYEQSSKKFGLDTVYSVSAIVACYKDALAIPIMYERLKATFTRMNIDFEIIFVNDCSPDDSEEVIRSLSGNDRRVIGISHSRNFGSQAAFRSGMEIASKNACVLLDGNLQDPPELIEQLVAQWRNGYDVVYGRRITSHKGLFRRISDRAFYRIFNYFSSINIPANTGDFSLIERRVVDAIRRFPERDLFLRGVRAFAGFKQIGVRYSPEPGVDTQRNESWLHGINRAKFGILSFSNVPLTILSYMGSGMLFLSMFLGIAQIAIRLAYPHRAASGITTVILIVLFFGALNIFCMALIGEYVGRIFEEVKCRPQFIRRVFIRDGEIRLAALNEISREV